MVCPVSCIGKSVGSCVSVKESMRTAVRFPMAVSSGYKAGGKPNKRISQAWRQPVYRLLCGRLLFETSAAPSVWNICCSVCFRKHLLWVIPSASKTSAALSVFVNTCPCSVCYESYQLLQKHMLDVCAPAHPLSFPSSLPRTGQGKRWGRNLLALQKQLRLVSVQINYIELKCVQASFSDL